jgi:hypothetical protein
MPSMYLNETKPFQLRPSKVIRKRFGGEIIGPYELVSLAGDGPYADSDWWKARCSKCNQIVTINVTRMANLKKAKGCVHCKGKL